MRPTIESKWLDKQKDCGHTSDKWFSKTSSLGLIQRRRALLQPGQCKHDWEVSAEIEKWEDRLRTLEVEEGNTEKMADKSKIATVREILTPKLREYVDLREGELDTYSRFREAVNEVRSHKARRA